MKNTNEEDIVFLLILLILNSITIIFENSIFQILAILLFIFISCFCSLDKIVYITVFCIPNNRVLMIFGISVPVIISIVYLIRILKNNVEINVKLITLCLMFILYCTQYILRYESIEYGLIFPIKFITMIIFFSQIYSNRVENITDFEYLTKILIYYFMGIVGSFFVSIINSGLNVLRFSIESNDPNFMSLQCSFLFACSLLLLVKNRQKILFISIISICFIMIILSGSRTGLFLLIYIFISFFVFIKFKEKYKAIILITIMLSLSYIILKNFDLIDQSFEYLIQRINSPRNEDISNGRYELWKLYLNYLFNNPIVFLFGSGSYVNLNISQIPPHNMFIDQMVSFGLIGNMIILVIYAYMFFYIIKQIEMRYGTIKISLISWLPMSIIFVGGMTLHGLVSFPNTMMFYIGIIMIYQYNMFDQNKLDLEL